MSEGQAAPRPRVFAHACPEDGFKVVISGIRCDARVVHAQRTVTRRGRHGDARGREERAHGGRSPDVHRLVDDGD